MPLADDAGVVALGFEEAGDGGAVFGDQARLVAGHDAALEFGAPGLAAGEEAVAGWRADRGAGVGVGEDHAIGGELVRAWGRDLTRLRGHAVDVAESQIIAQDHDDVRLVRSCGSAAEVGEDKADGEGQKTGELGHETTTEQLS